MKRQFILAVAIVFTLALWVPAVSYAVQAGTPVVIVDNKEKKDEAKTTAETEKKSEAATSETKACGDKEQKAACSGTSKAEGKACSGETKACTGEKKPCCASQKADK
jgi:ABC-type sugar transport system substrate-binding protein